MDSLYVVSTESYSGKTALIAALMRRLRRDGLDPGYMKPVSGSPRAVGDELLDLDAQFIRGTFDLEATLSELVPIRLTDSVLDQELERTGPEADGKRGELLVQIERGYEELSKRNDFLLVEGAGELAEGGLIGLSAARIAAALGLPTLVVMRYTDRLSGDDLLQASRVLGGRMIGGVINAVPEHQKALFEARTVPALEARGVPVVGVVPYRRLLGGATVQELADQIGGEFLVGERQADALVETLCIGAMSIDDVLAHFRRKRNKAVIVEGARSNIQLAALETSTRCLILTGNLEPKPAIITRAQQRGVPVILSELSTIETVDVINQYFGRTRFHQEEKLVSLEDALEENFDFEWLYREMGWERASST
jgi:hypothetical protein